MSEQKTPILEIFPCLEGFAGMCGGLSEAFVLSVVVHRESFTMEVSCRTARMPAPAELSTLSDRLKAEYGLKEVILKCDYPRPADSGVTKAAPKSKSAGKVLYGRPI